LGSVSWEKPAVYIKLKKNIKIFHLNLLIIFGKNRRVKLFTPDIYSTGSFAKERLPCKPPV
jgi:hypothetical protein